MTQKPTDDIPLTVGAAQKQIMIIMIKDWQREPSNSCEDFIRLVVNFINFSFVSN